MYLKIGGVFVILRPGPPGIKLRTYLHFFSCTVFYISFNSQSPLGHKYYSSALFLLFYLDMNYMIKCHGRLMDTEKSCVCILGS